MAVVAVTVVVGEDDSSGSCGSDGGGGEDDSSDSCGSDGGGGRGRQQ